MFCGLVSMYYNFFPFFSFSVFFFKLFCLVKANLKGSKMKGKANYKGEFMASP